MVSFMLLLCAIFQVLAVKGLLLSLSPVTLDHRSYNYQELNKEMYTAGYSTNSRRGFIFGKDLTLHHWKHPTTTSVKLFSFSSDEELFVALYREKETKNSTENTYHLPNQTNNSYVSNEEDEKVSDTTGSIRSLPFEECDIGPCVPTATLKPEEIVPLLMNALHNFDHPTVDNGLIAMWEFTTDTTKYVFQNNRTEFIESCHETARDFPTSFYGAAMLGRSWTIETELNRVGGETGWIATQVTSTISSDGRRRRWQWELRKNKRPPCLGCWRVENIASSDRKGNFEPD